MSEKVACDIGNFISTYVEADPKNFDDAWSSYMRICVLLDVRKPLKRKMNEERLESLYIGKSVL